MQGASCSEAGNRASLLSQNFDLTKLEKLRTQLPYLEKRYTTAVRMKAEMNEALREVLDLSAVPPGTDILGNIPFNARALYLVPRVPDAILQRDTEEMTAYLSRSSETREDLFRCYTETANTLRLKLANGSDTEQKEAARKLRVMPESLARAMRRTEPRLEANLGKNFPMFRAA